jgi:hypothetical protein
VSIVTTANSILYGRANTEFRTAVWVPGTGVDGFDAAGVGGRKSIGDIAGEAMMLLNPSVEDAGIGEGEAIDDDICCETEWENCCDGVR